MAETITQSVPSSLPPKLVFLSQATTVRIGVTGHRVLRNPELVQESVHRILSEIDRKLATAAHSYNVISALAEGADRLVARCVLEWKGTNGMAPLLQPKLEVALPMPKHDYFETFSIEEREASVHEFENLLRQASPVKRLPATASRGEAYEQLGRYVAGHCDVLIAIWDGKPARGKGGTAHVVQMARSNDRAVYWIHSRTGAVRRFTNKRDFISQIDFLNEYNREPIDEAVIAEETGSRLQKLQQKAVEAQLDPQVLEPLRAGVIPHFVKAGKLAGQYQNLHFRSGTAAYILGACAVGTAALLALIFRSSSHWLFLIEALEIAGVIVLVWPPAFRSWQRKWIDYRYLAERLRASCFLYVAGLREEGSEPPPDMQISTLPASWVVVALREAWQSLPQHNWEDETVHQPPGPVIARFIAAAWLEEQRKYYEDAAETNRKSHERLEILLTGIIIFTLAAAVLHVILPLFGFHMVEKKEILDWLSVFAVTLPAFASAIAGISIFRNFNRNAERYRSMNKYLRRVEEHMSEQEGAHPSRKHDRESLSWLQSLVREADRSMAHEHQGWRVVFGIHLPGPG